MHVQTNISETKKVVFCKKVWEKANGNTRTNGRQQFSSENNTYFCIFQSEVGWLGFWSSIVACGTALISGHVADKLIGHFKLVLLILLTISTGCFIWICFICTKVIPFSIGKNI